MHDARPLRAIPQQGMECAAAAAPAVAARLLPLHAGILWDCWQAAWSGGVIEYFWIEPFSGIEIMTAHQTAWRTTAPSRPARPWPDATLRASAGAPAAPRLRSDIIAPGLHSVSPALRGGLPRHRAFPLLRARRQPHGRLAARPGSQRLPGGRRFGTGHFIRVRNGHVGRVAGGRRPVSSEGIQLSPC